MARHQCEQSGTVNLRCDAASAQPQRVESLPPTRSASMRSHTVIVAFAVEADDPETAERIVEERLEGARILMEDGKGPEGRDPMRTWTVLPVERLLDDSL